MLCVHFYFGVISFVSLPTFIDSSNVDNLIQTITHVHASRNNNNLKINETVKPWITWLDPFYLSTMFVGELNDTGGFKDKEKPLSKTAHLLCTGNLKTKKFFTKFKHVDDNAMKVPTKLHKVTQWKVKNRIQQQWKWGSLI